MTSFLVGGYGPDMGGDAVGIRRATSGPGGVFTLGALAIELPSPSWITVSGDRVYAALEGTGELAVLTRDLELLDRVPAGGEFPCHIGVAGDTAIVACYGDGAVAVHPRGAPVRVLAGSGSGPREAQDGPHAHHVLVAGDRILTLDLGADALHVHDLGMTRLSTIVLPPGTGPRDLLALPGGRFLLLGEHSGELLLLTAELEIAQRTRLAGFGDGDQAAGLALIAGRFVASGIRGSNRLSITALTDAGLAPVTAVPSGGEWPRHLVADGSVVHVANQLSSTVASFTIDDEGHPEPVGEPVPVPSPTCLAAVIDAPNL
ncbi:MAG TPA: beta-propeller fold lactonase family protein [Pseudolysinimonas sp.]|nr:beta-propeller fold lactonase family protein [Pseudolysinimonas sp.]